MSLWVSEDSPQRGRTEPKKYILCHLLCHPDLFAYCLHSRICVHIWLVVVRVSAESIYLGERVTPMQ